VKKETQQKQSEFSDSDKVYEQNLSDYIKRASIKNILSIPFIWVVLIPTILLDVSATCYQAICFSVYGIPKVKRVDYLVFDRHILKYLNVVEKLNCLYCSYFNGVIAYLREIGARTEQYWCPIKHARRASNEHSRYQHFVEYGDAQSFRQNKEEIRVNFYDLRS
jgi:hypothetical protein